MKKVMILAISLMTAITLYFVCVWEPEVVEENINVSSEVVEKEKTEEKVNQVKIEEEKKKQIVEQQMKMEKVIKSMTKAEQEKVLSLIEKVSTSDMLRIQQEINKGNTAQAKGIIRERLLEDDSKILFEIFGKYIE